MPRARGDNRAASAFFCALTLCGALVAVAPAAAAEVSLQPGLPDCVPGGDNALVELTLVPEAGWSSVRVYFRDHDEELWYFLEMRAEGGGKYWAALPQPEADTTEVDIQFRVRDFQGGATQSEVFIVNVTSSCKSDLTEAQKAFARNLVVGETALKQKDREVFGFECDGIISRLEDYTGDLRPDEYCRAVLLAAVVPKTRLLLLLPIVGVFDDGEPPAVSPARP